MIIKDITILIIVLLLFWSGMVIADISAGDNFIFECSDCSSLGEEVLDFIRSGGSQTYTITINSVGSFSIDQGEAYKFKIDSSGDVNWVGSLSGGTFDLKIVPDLTSCFEGLAYGIDSDGLRCVEDCNDDCLEYGSSGGDRTCNLLPLGDQNCWPCSYCDGVNDACVVKDAGVNDRCPTCTTCNASGSCIAITDGFQDTAGDNQCDGFCQGCYGGSCTNADGDDPRGDCDTGSTSALGCGIGYCNASGTCQYYTSEERECPTCYTCSGATSPSCVAIGNDVRDPEGSNLCNEACHGCNGVGDCVHENWTDYNDSCPSVGCFTGICDTGEGNCAYDTTGEGSCGVCKTCNASGDCVAYSDNTQDTSGATSCDGPCAACVGGECDYAPGGTDPGNTCGKTLCYTGNCDGTGTCEAYSGGNQQGCSTCSYCSDADTGCEYRANNYRDEGCGVCKVCNGSGSCKSATTAWGSRLYGCDGDDKRCVSGTCRTCSGGFSAVFDDGCEGCAGQGGQACWRRSTVPQETCTEKCSSYGGCVAASWNANPSCDLYPLLDITCGTCTNAGDQNFSPAFYPGGPWCSFRSSGSQSCGADGGSAWWRECVCLY